MRLKRFEALQNHPWYSGQIKKLTGKDRSYCLGWIIANDHLDKNEFAFKTNRMFLDNERKPKNHALIWELLSLVS